MTTPELALQKMREICLELPDTSEKSHFGDAAFYVGKKMFASCGVKHGVCQVCFGLEPDHAARLLETDPRFQPYPRDKRALCIDAATIDDWEEMRPLLLESYGLVRPMKSSRKKAAPKD